MTGIFGPYVNGICGTLPGAAGADPLGRGRHACNPGGRMFTCQGAVDPGVSVKCANVDTAALLIDAGVAARATYFHQFWIRMPEDCPSEVPQHRTQLSYDPIRSCLPKHVQKDPAPRQGGDHVSHTG